MPVFNPYTNTNDQPILPDFAGWNSQYLGLKTAAQAAFGLAWHNWVMKYNIPQSVQDQWNAENLAAASPEQQKNFWQKVKDAVNTVKSNVSEGVNTVKDKASDVKDKVTSILQTGKEKAALSLFLPFTAVAIIFLRRRGIEPAKTVKGLVLQVNAEMGKSNFGFSEQGDSFDFGGTGERYGLTGPEADSQQLPINPGVIINTIKFLKDILDAIKEKKKSGAPLTPDEQKILDMAADIDKGYNEAKDVALNIEKESESEAEAVSGGNTKMIIGVFLLLVLLFFLFRK